MRVLLDHCVDVRFRRLLAGHDVRHTKEMGWEELSNGNLLSTAEEAGFQVFVTVDKNMRHQQNMSKRRLSLITLGSRFTGFDDIEPLAAQVLLLLESEVPPGTQHIVVPFTGE